MPLQNSVKSKAIIKKEEKKLKDQAKAKAKAAIPPPVSPELPFGDHVLTDYNKRAKNQQNLLFKRLAQFSSYYPRSDAAWGFKNANNFIQQNWQALNDPNHALRQAIAHANGFGNTITDLRNRLNDPNHALNQGIAQHNQIRTDLLNEMPAMQQHRDRLSDTSDTLTSTAKTMDLMDQYRDRFIKKETNEERAARINQELDDAVALRLSTLAPDHIMGGTGFSPQLLAHMRDRSRDAVVKHLEQQRYAREVDERNEMMKFSNQLAQQAEAGARISNLAFDPLLRKSDLEIKNATDLANAGNARAHHDNQIAHLDLNRGTNLLNAGNALATHQANAANSLINNSSARADAAAVAAGLPSRNFAHIANLAPQMVSTMHKVAPTPQSDIADAATFMAEPLRALVAPKKDGDTKKDDKKDTKKDATTKKLGGLIKRAAGGYTRNEKMEKELEQSPEEYARTASRYLPSIEGSSENPLVVAMAAMATKIREGLGPAAQYAHEQLNQHFKDENERKRKEKKLAFDIQKTRQENKQTYYKDDRDLQQKYYNTDTMAEVNREKTRSEANIEYAKLKQAMELAKRNPNREELLQDGRVVVYKDGQPQGYKTLKELRNGNPNEAQPSSEDEKMDSFLQQHGRKWTDLNNEERKDLTNRNAVLAGMASETNNQFRRLKEMEKLRLDNPNMGSGLNRFFYNMSGLGGDTLQGMFDSKALSAQDLLLKHAREGSHSITKFLPAKAQNVYLSKMIQETYPGPNMEHNAALKASRGKVLDAAIKDFSNNWVKKARKKGYGVDAGDAMQYIETHPEEFVEYLRKRKIRSLSEAEKSVIFSNALQDINSFSSQDGQVSVNPSYEVFDGQPSFIDASPQNAAQAQTPNAQVAASPTPSVNAEVAQKAQEKAEINAGIKEILRQLNEEKQ